MKLLGPAALNDIYVHEGNIYGIPKDAGKLSSELVGVTEKGIKVKFSVLDAISEGIAADIEDMIKAGKKTGLIQFRMAKNPADLNIEITKTARRFITSLNRKIILKGPVFMSVEFEAE